MSNYGTTLGMESNAILDGTFEHRSRSKSELKSDVQNGPKVVKNDLILVIFGHFWCSNLSDNLVCFVQKVVKLVDF